MVRLRDTGRFSHRLNSIREAIGASAMLSRLRSSRRPRKITAHCHAVLVDALENRTLLSSSDLTITNTLIVSRNPATNMPLVGQSAPTGLTPAQMRNAYDVAMYDNTLPVDGAGQTIAIVDAYNDPTIHTDLAAFDSYFGFAAPPSFQVLSQTGTTTLPGTDPSGPGSTHSWEYEEALDVEWAHAMAPGANIVLVEANSAGSDLYTAVDTARSLSGVSVVSMSWGGAESATEAADTDPILTTPGGHNGVTFLASTGDNGSYDIAGTSYPALSPNVIGVGGTSLTTTINGNYTSESAWTGGGGGISSYELQPAFQTGTVTQSSTSRTVPDVAFDADPNTGVPIYDSYDNTAATPWAQFGGTSLSAPCWSGIIAIANQARAIKGLPALDGPSQTLPMLYAMRSGAFNDVNTGNDGTYLAGNGYDLTTGLGSPVASSVVSVLSGLDVSSHAATIPASSLPAPTTTFSESITGSSTSTQFSAPSIAYDPNNPMFVVAAYVQTFAAAKTGMASNIGLSYSTNGGATWTAEWDSNASHLNIVDTDPGNTNMAYFAQATDPSVSFDGADTFYVSDLQESTSAASGEVVLSKFEVNVAADVVTPDLTVANTNVYEWDSGNANTAPSAVTLAVDSNHATYTDPITNGTITDPTIISNVYPVYVGYTSGKTLTVLTSMDGGATFPVTSTYTGTANLSGLQMTIAQGSLGSVAAGQLDMVFDAGAAVDFASDAGGANGVVGKPVTIANAFTSDTITAAGTAITPAPVIASDNSLGAYAEFSGNLYVAYTFEGSGSGNTDIALWTSSDGGETWSQYVNPAAASDSNLPDKFAVNDDDAQVDGFSNATPTSGRSQFAPSISVDPTNGTVVLSWYDARYSAGNNTVARYVTTSIDGGESFGAQTYLNEPNQVYNAITGAATNLGPIPDNVKLTAGFGATQGLAVYGGHIYAAWSGNQDGGATGNEALNILTSLTTYSAGPRIVSSTQGVVSTPEDIVNPANDNSPQFQYIDVTFDRPISPLSTYDSVSDPYYFSAADVEIDYRNDTTPGTMPPTAILTGTSNIAAIIPLNYETYGDAQAPGATEFRIVLTTPQTAVGTYSYSIKPVMTNGYVYTGLGDFNDNAGATTFAKTANLTIPPVNKNYAYSQITIASAASNELVADLNVTLQLNGPSDQLSNFDLYLIGPNGIVVPLSLDRDGASQTAASNPAEQGHGYIATTFDDQASTPVADANFQFSGTYQPENVQLVENGVGLENKDALSMESAGLSPTAFGQGLASYNNLPLTNGGIWTLFIADSRTNTGTTPTALLQNWSLAFQTMQLNTNVAAPYAGMPGDQNGDAISGQSPLTSGTVPQFQSLGDVYAMPAPTSAEPFTTNSGETAFISAPFDSGTSPIVIAGPQILSSIDYPGTGGLSILADQTVSTTLAISGDSAQVIENMLVKLSIDFPNTSGLQASDLIVTLFAPDGTPITLVSNPAGGTGTIGDTADFGADGFTVFSDDASENIDSVSVTSPYIGLFEPVTSLSELNGKELSGTWRLQIQNTSGTAANVGTLEGWSLTAATSTDSVDSASAGGYSQMTVTFDRDMNPATIIPSAISITGPLGAVTGTFQVVEVNARTYTIQFPAQTSSGEYSVEFADSITSAAGDPLDADQNAGLTMLRGASSTTTAYTPPSTNFPLSINKLNGPTTSTITVPANEDFLIGGITLNLNVTYKRDTELSAFLIAPDGTTIELFSNLSSTGSNFGITNGNTTFQDIAATPITSGQAPFFGTYSPEQPLLQYLQNKQSAGTWTLEIQDSGSNIGTLNSWGITFNAPVLNSGAGANSGDAANVNFTLFNMAANDPESHEVWTAVGSGATNTGASSTSGPVTAIAVDPADPSGNTVYIGAATGGIWKTTDFLTTSPDGPSYLPLTDFEGTGSLDIASIAVLPGANGNTNNSMIFALTGNPDTQTGGVGVLISANGGQSWTLSNDNGLFTGQVGYKIIVDPNLNAQSNALLYLAISGNNGGIYSSTDSGQTWVKNRAGQATDVIFDPNSGVKSFQNVTNNLNTIIAAFAGDGVWSSPNRGVVWNPLLGGVGDPLIQAQDAVGNPSIPVTGTGSTSPASANSTRIILGKPAKTGDPVVDDLYEGWIYAAVIGTAGGTPGGSLEGLYITKDYGENWTEIKIDTAASSTVAPDNGGSTQYDVTKGNALANGIGNYAFAMTVDPNDPNVVYLAGSQYANMNAGMIRVDTSGISDAHSFYQDVNGSGSYRTATTGVTTLNNAGGTTTAYPNPVYQPTINLIQNPSQPFVSGSAIYVDNVSSFANNGGEVSWIPFDSAFGLSGSNVNPEVPTVSEYHAMLAMTDPLTGQTRLIVGTEQGVFSAVDQDGTFRSGSADSQNPGSAAPGITTSLGEAPQGSRNGNLQIAEDVYGAVQPSADAANSAGALFYANAVGEGLIQSSPDVLSSGNITWSSAQGSIIPSDGSGVSVDQTGGGTVYDYTNPFYTLTDTDFFEVNGVGRTSGLLQSTAGAGTTHDDQWPDLIPTTDLPASGDNFAVDPVNSAFLVIASDPTGADGSRIFATQDTGQHWAQISPNTGLDSGMAQVLAYGAPINGANGDLIYAGTTLGNVFVTFNGGGGSGNQWLKISTATFDGSPIVAIMADPIPGGPDSVYVVTQKNVYFSANVDPAKTGGAVSWTAITGNLLSANPAAQSLTTAIGDWRYATPILYVGADSGVYRGIFNATTLQWHWETFPDVSADQAPVEGGYLPDVSISDLDLSTGNVQPSTGLPETASDDPDALVASTYGRGTYAIRLAPDVTTAALSNALPGTVISAGGNPFQIYETDDRTFSINGSSEENIQNFNEAVMSIYLLDINGAPVTPQFLGGFDPTDLSTSTSDPHGKFYAGNIAGTDGVFSISTTTPLANQNGVYTIGIEATDNANVTGAYYTITVDLEVKAPTITGLSLTAATDTGSSPTDLKTNDTTPTITGVGAAGATVTITVTGPGGAQVYNGITADNTGLFNFTIPNALTPDGDYTIVASEVDPFGHASSAPQASFVMTLVTQVSTPADPLLDIGSDSGVSSADGVTNQTMPTFAGTLPDGASDADNTVTLIITPAAGGTAYTQNTLADSDGNYSFTVGTALTDGTYSVQVQQTDVEGNVSAASPGATPLVIDTTDPLVLPISIVANQYTNFSGILATIFDANGEGTATIDWGDGSPDTSTSDGNSDVTIEEVSPTSWDLVASHEYTTQAPANAPFNITINVTDQAGNPATPAGDTAEVDEPVITVTPTEVQPSEGEPYIDTIATFQSGVPLDSDFNATVDWGDGTTADTSGNGNVTIVPDPNDLTGLLYDVVGTHTYADGPATDSITVTVDSGDASALQGQALSQADVLNVIPTAGVTGDTHGVPNQSLSFTFSATDPSTPDSTAGFTYVIDWGDTHSHNVTATNNNGAGVDLNHTYAASGNYTISVIATDKDGGPSVAATYDVEIAGITAVSPNPTAPEGDSTQVILATITNASDFTAADFTPITITWGDGSGSDTSSGIIQDNGDGTFSVLGTHTYADGPATENTSVTVGYSDTSLPVVHPGVSVTNVNPTITSFSGPAEALATELLTFPITTTDPSGPDTAAGFTYSINWGDTHTQVVNKTANNGAGLNLTHTYTAAGDYNITVTAMDKDGGISTPATNYTVDVSQLLAGAPITNLAEGAPTANYVVATISNAATLPDLSNITVNWGDGTTDNNATLLPGPNSTYQIVDPHVYQDGPHSYSIATSVTPAGSNTAISVQESAGVINVPPTAAIQGTAEAIVNQTVSEQISATDPGSVDTTTGFTYAINWGDGSVLQTILPTANNGTGLTETHAYAAGGTYTVSVTAKDKDGDTSLQAATDTVQIANVTGVDIASAEGSSFSGPVATITGAAGFSAADFTATINWGDNTATLGTIVNNRDGTFSIDGQHGYVDGPNTYTVGTTVTFQSAAMQSTSTATVANIKPTATLFGPTNALASQLVTFTLAASDPGTVDLAAGFTYSINFGDGQSQIITPSAGNNVGAPVSHAYSTGGNYTVSVTTTDKDGDPSTAVTQNISVAAVAMAALPDQNEGATFSGTIATLSNASAYQAGNLTASINWGDGTTTTGAVTADPNHAGSFLVAGTHTYGDGPANDTISVTITAGSASTSANGSVKIDNVAPTAAINGAVGGFVGQSLAINLSATDPSSADTAAGFTYQINWGDGATQTISAAANNGAGVAPTHTYTVLGNYTVTVTATDKDSGVVGAATHAFDIVANPQIQNFHASANSISFTLPQTAAPITSLNSSDFTLVRDGSQTISLAGAPVTFDPTTGNVSINTSSLNLPAGDYQVYPLPGTQIMPGAFSIGINESALVTKVVKLNPGKKVTAPHIKFPTLTLGGAPEAPVIIALQNISTTQSVTLTQLSFLSSGPFTYAVQGEPYGASNYVIGAGQTLYVRVYYTPTIAGSSKSQLKAEFTNAVASNYGAVVAKFSAKAINPKVSSSITKKILKGKKSKSF